MSEDVVVPFKTADGIVGDGFVIEPDDVLESAKGVYQQVVVVGFDQRWPD